MLQVVNLTPFVAEILVFPSEQGVESAYAVVKGTFQILPTVVPAGEQLPVVLADVHWGDPAASSLKYPSEATLLKPAADVWMSGHAYAPQGKPIDHLDVSLSVGPLSKTVRVFGDREWKKGVLTTSATTPKPFERMPLTYERAFGGADRSREKDGILEAEPRNPVGTGFLGKKSSLPVDGIRLPNLEDPKHLIGSPKDRPAPASFGPVCGHWEPRRLFTGTYDEAWQNNRAPYLPTDFDNRYFNAGAPGLVAPGFLTGGELVEIKNASPQGMLRFQLPALQLRVIFTIAGEDIECAPSLDTVGLEPDHNRLTLVWRTSVACDKKTLKVRQIQVECTGL